jgi:hypothetical protein
MKRIMPRQYNNIYNICVFLEAKYKLATPRTEDRDKIVWEEQMAKLTLS